MTDINEQNKPQRSSGHEVKSNDLLAEENKLQMNKLFCMTWGCNATPIYNIEGDGDSWSLCRGCFNKNLRPSM